MSRLCIGLFGTCGTSRWRTPFIREYNGLGIEYFDPQVPVGEWHGKLAGMEAEHMVEDAIILFPVTTETYALGSLAEIGFWINQASSLEDRRDFVLMIEPMLDRELDDPILREHSLKMRALVREHVMTLRLDNVYLVDTFEQMLTTSLALHEVARLREKIRRYNPKHRTF